MVDFVLAQYVKPGVGELYAEKLSLLLRLRYQALSDVFAEQGKPEQVRQVMVGPGCWARALRSPVSASASLARPSGRPGLR